MLKRFWQGLPWDGQGWNRLTRGSRGDGANADGPLMAALRHHAAAGWRRHQLPPVLRAPFWLADRTAWPLAALGRARAYASAVGLHPAESLALFWGCLLTGGDPMEVHVWRSLFGGRHPLPARSAARLLTGLGAPETHALLADKLTAADHLAATGAVFPALCGMLRRNEPVCLARLAGLGPDLFMKPRHGQGGRNAFALARDGEGWRIDGCPVETAALLSRLEMLTRRDDLLVQERLTPAPSLAELCAGTRAPVLRLATARLPGEAPFLHSALLTLPFPGRNPRDFRKGAIHVPADPADGRLAAGLSLAAPHERMERLPGNGAQLYGRPLPWFAEAVIMALHAMAALPPVPLVHWDILPARTGPVLLEGNSAGNWILASLPGAYGLDAGSLAPLLARWM